MIKVGDLVRMTGNSMCGAIGIVTKVPRVEGFGMWAILLTSGELIATGRRSRIEVMNATR
jgi:hypothetical protein